MNLNICKPAPGQMAIWLAKETALFSAFEQEEAERQRRRTQKIIDDMAKGSPESRVAAAKARARATHAKIDDTNAQAELESNQNEDLSAAVDPETVRIDDLETLFKIRERLTPRLRARIEKLHAKFHWQTKKGQKGYFNVAVHENNIPVDKNLTILAHIFGATDGNRELDTVIDSIMECGLFPKVKKSVFRKGKKIGEEHCFHYTRRCQNGEECNLCNWINISDGLKVLLESYDEAAFNRGGNWFAFTLAPRSDPAKARAVGRTITPEDWKYENPESIVYRELQQGRVFSYPDPYCSNDALDHYVESAIRRYLGACQITFGKLVKNGWLEGVRAKVENSIEFLPFASHQHWHVVGSSRFEHDPQKMAEFIKEEVDAILAQTCRGLYVDVMVAEIPTPADLEKWIRYINKTVDLAGAIDSVYSRHPSLRRSDPLFEELSEELRRYRERSRRVFDMVRYAPHEYDERGAHTYKLNRRFVRGNHKFGKGSILSEPLRHREWRKRHAAIEAEFKSRRKVRAITKSLGLRLEKCPNRQPDADAYNTFEIWDVNSNKIVAAGPSGRYGFSLMQCENFLKKKQKSLPSHP